jgi:pimeloyl-ACP methyl ester carboxylesterase
VGISWSIDWRVLCKSWRDYRLPPGAEAFKRDNPGAEVHFFETGHFALETHAQEIANAIRDFLGRKLDGAEGRTK